MKKNLRRLSLLLCLMFTVSMLASCGGGDKDIDKPADVQAETQVETKAGGEEGGADSAPKEKIEITYMAWYNNETEPIETQKTLDKFNSENDEINVKLVSVAYADYVTKLNTMASSNSLPDIRWLLKRQSNIY